jgi:SRSO17 transposase
MGARPAAPKKSHVPEDVVFRTKPGIALDLVRRALANGVRVKAWTFDELYGRCGPFLDELHRLGQAFVGEIPSDFRVWLEKPRRVRKRCGSRDRRPPRCAGARRASQVRHLRRHSPDLCGQRPQRYCIKDGHLGPEVWEVRWRTCWRCVAGPELASVQHTLLIARNVLTDETKYFLTNRVPGRPSWNIRALLRVAFGRWSIEQVFREAKEELGFDHYECRGWRCIHRHLACVILSQRFCAQVREQLSSSEDVFSEQRLTLEQVRRSVAVFVNAGLLPPRHRATHYRREQHQQEYYQRRNTQAYRSHHKTRRKRFEALGIDPDRIKSCVPKKPDPPRE